MAMSNAERQRRHKARIDKCLTHYQGDLSDAGIRQLIDIGELDPNDATDPVKVGEAVARVIERSTEIAHR